jgi:predicted amidophosphoribosyltransferase
MTRFPYTLAGPNNVCPDCMTPYPRGLDHCENCRQDRLEQQEIEQEANREENL